MKYGKLIFISLVACGSTSKPNAPNPEAAFCIGHRTAMQIECGDLARTREEADTCKAKIRADLDCTKLEDAGSEGGDR